MADDDDGKYYYLYYDADDASHVGERRIGVAVADSSPTGPFTKKGIALDYSGGGWEGTIVGTPAIAKIGTKYYISSTMDTAMEQIELAWPMQPAL